MDQIDDFVGRFVAWTDETGAEGNPDLGLIRDLLQARAEVPELWGLRDDLGVPAVMIWPNSSLRRLVLDVAPFSFPMDADARQALIRTLPLLRDFIRMRCTVETEDTIRKETSELLATLTGPKAASMEQPTRWALTRRAEWLRHKFEPPPGNAGDSWYARFGRQPWARQDELLGPIWRPPIQLPTPLWGDAVVPPPTTALPSTLCAAARTAPLLVAVIEVSEFLGDRTGIWSGARLSDGVVQQVIDATSLTEAVAVQEAWRLAVLAGFLWPTPWRVFRGEKLDLYADPDEVLVCWADVARNALTDLPDPRRDTVVGTVLAAYHPGIDRGDVELLQRLGVLDGFELTPLGRTGVVMPWAGWTAGVLQAGAWRPDLTTADVETWLLALTRNQLDGTSVWWPTSADPKVFAGQVAAAMLSVRLPAARVRAFGVLGSLGADGAQAVRQLAGTPLNAYYVISGGPDAQVAFPLTAEQADLCIADFDAYTAAAAELLDAAQVGQPVDPRVFQAVSPPAEEQWLLRLRAGAPCTAEDVEQLRGWIAGTADDLRALLRSLAPAGG